jgi:hypothetical protein
MQKLIWTLRDSNLPLLVHPTMHSPSWWTTPNIAVDMRCVFLATAHCVYNGIYNIVCVFVFFLSQ